MHRNGSVYSFSQGSGQWLSQWTQRAWNVSPQYTVSVSVQNKMAGCLSRLCLWIRLISTILIFAFILFRSFQCLPSSWFVWKYFGSKTCRPALGTVELPNILMDEILVNHNIHWLNPVNFVGPRVRQIVVVLLTSFMIQHLHSLSFAFCRINSVSIGSKTCTEKLIFRKFFPGEINKDGNNCGASAMVCVWFGEGRGYITNEKWNE